MNGNKDITKDFLDACKKCLAPGEIAHESYFNLRYAMSAIDIMNPTMDAGMVKSRKVAHLRQTIESGGLPLGVFEDREVLLGIIDELIVLFVNWITGDPLIQTVYTCMYMHCIPYIQDKRLALFCETLRRNVIFFRRVMLTLPSFEDEDFCSAQVKIPLTFDTSAMYPTLDVANDYFCLPSEVIATLLQSLQKELLKSEELDNCMSDRMELIRLFLKFEEHFSDFLTVLVEEDLEETYENTELKEFGEPLGLGSKREIESVNLTPGLFTKRCDDLISVSSKIVRICKNLLQTANRGKDAGPGKSHPESEVYSLPGFEPYLTLSNLTSTVQRFPRALKREPVFSFLSCAFSRVINVIEEMKTLINCHPFNIVFLHEVCSVSHRLGHNMCHCLFKKEELSNPLDVKDSNSRSCALSRAILSVVMGALFKCPVVVDPRLTTALTYSSTAMHFFTSWLAVEPKWIRDRVLDNAENLQNFGCLFDNAFIYLYKVCRCYTFNRSRQRTNMSRIFEDLNALIEDTIGVEATFSQHLSELTQKSSTPSSSITLYPLRITAYICFFYYHLIWDFLITGFQLDLYAPREWVYVYTLIITLQRNLGAFINHMASHPPDETTSQPNTSSSSTVTSSSTSSKKRKRKKEPGSSTLSTTPEQSRLSEVLDLPTVTSDYWGFQIAQSNIHRFLSVGTLYVLRALQRDAGYDVSTMKPVDEASTAKVYSSLKTQFLHRMGPAINSKFSPLLGNETAEAFFNSTHEYVSGGALSEISTSDLYEMAGKVFGMARQWIQTANMPTLTTRFIGPVDDLAKLDRLAKNNEIVCRLLVARPEKRPTQGGEAQELKIKREHPFHPVHLDFQHLLSKSYPLLRLS